MTEKSLRDEFALTILPTAAAYVLQNKEAFDLQGNRLTVAQLIANQAYEIADAMMEERKKYAGIRERNTTQSHTAGRSA